MLRRSRPRSGQLARFRTLDNPDLNPWKAGKVNAVPPKTSGGCGGVYLLIAVLIMVLENFSYSLLTGSNRTGHFPGDKAAFALSLVATCVSLCFSVRGAFVSSAAIRNPEKDLAAACLFFLSNFIVSSVLFVLVMSYLFSPLG